MADSNCMAAAAGSCSAGMRAGYILVGYMVENTEYSPVYFPVRKVDIREGEGALTAAPADGFRSRAAC